MNAPRSIGDHLRDWRQRRRMSQLDLAVEAEISTRHLSFVETGRSVPSRDMVLQLAERVDVPLREQNVLLTAAGYAPVFPETPLGDQSLDGARKAMDLVLAGHQPYPALAIDRHWTMVAANRAVAPLVASVEPGLLAPPVNVLRLSLHPGGLAPRIANLAEWRAHLLERLRRQIEISADATLITLLQEVRGYPILGASARKPPRADLNSPVVPLQLNVDGRQLSLISTTTVFGTPIDITLSELALETFFPADAETAEALRALAPGG